MSNGKGRLLKAASDPWVYHHKWLFVADDYRGFDVAAGKRRSESWTTLGLDRSRIGKRSQWLAATAKL